MKIELNISEFGETELNVLDGDSTSCELATKSLSDVLGKVYKTTNTEYKEEYFNGDKEQEVHVTQS